MPTEHTVKQGENLSKIARDYGLPSFRALVRANPDFASGKRDPNLIYPGEVILVPVDDELLFEVKTDRWHRFLAHRDHAELDLVIEDRNHTPVPFARYELTVTCEQAPTVAISGRTGFEGELRQLLPPDALSGQLKVWMFESGKEEEVEEYELQLHHLDPPETLTGVQARLKNLGYYDKEVDDKKGSGTDDAIHEFKAVHGLPEDSEITPAFVDALRQAHGS